ncbi:hypothetical protein ANANG_G00013360, partial [Anguilla anguilla]
LSVGAEAWDLTAADGVIRAEGTVRGEGPGAFFIAKTSGGAGASPFSTAWAFSAGAGRAAVLVTSTEIMGVSPLSLTLAAFPGSAFSPPAEVMDSATGIFPATVSWRGAGMVALIWKVFVAVNSTAVTFTSSAVSAFAGTARSAVITSKESLGVPCATCLEDTPLEGMGSAASTGGSDLETVFSFAVCGAPCVGLLSEASRCATTVE